MFQHSTHTIHPLLFHSLHHHCGFLLHKPAALSAVLCNAHTFFESGFCLFFGDTADKSNSWRCRRNEKMLPPRGSCALRTKNTQTNKNNPFSILSDLIFVLLSQFTGYIYSQGSRGGGKLHWENLIDLFMKKFGLLPLPTT